MSYRMCSIMGIEHRCLQTVFRLEFDLMRQTGLPEFADTSDMQLSATQALAPTFSIQGSGEPFVGTRTRSAALSSAIAPYCGPVPRRTNR